MAIQEGWGQYLATCEGRLCRAALSTWQPTPEAALLDAHRRGAIIRKSTYTGSMSMYCPACAKSFGGDFLASWPLPDELTKVLEPADGRP
jgi:hypothetical protein